MNALVAVCVRWTDPRPAVDPLSGAVARDAHRAILPPADSAALEHALRIAEAWSGRVLALCAGPPAATGALRDVAAVGAQPLRVPWPPHAGTEADGLEAAAAYMRDLAADERDLARALAGAIRTVGEPAVVICADRSADRGTGALPAYLADELEAAQALGLVALAVEGDTLLGERRLDGGRRERLRITPPAVCSVEAAGVRLRRASLPAMLEAAELEVPVVPPTPLPVAGVRVESVRPYRPRTHLVPPPPGREPRERLIALTGALTEHEPPTIIGPVDAAQAADALLEFLTRNGYLR